MSVDIRKTYKLYVGGKFPRSESGRAYQPQGCPQVNVARASRKDLRDAVTAARAALEGWSGLTAYNRGQVLYRLAEMLQTRAASLAGEIAACTGDKPALARREVETAIELTTWYAGLPDKLQTLLGSQNAVSGPFFNFSTVEPTGAIGIGAPAQPALLGLLTLLLPVLAGGNTAVVLVSEPAPLPGLALGELLAVSDFPGGVVNLLAGLRSELLPQLASHRDVDGLLLAGPPDKEIGAAAADSVKRVRCCDLDHKQARDLSALQQLSFVEPFVEVKTFWHPIAY
jgi:acyl-CoA reductase-like NAD-dependent aldehyde dehydrogenase